MNIQFYFRLTSFLITICFSVGLTAQTLRDEIAHLLVRPPVGFDVNSITASHPRFIDIDALRTKIDDAAYADVDGRGTSARDLLEEAGDARNPDPIANALLWHLDGNTTRRDQAKADLLANNFVRKPRYWGMAPGAFPSIMQFWAYDLLANELTTAEKTAVWDQVCLDMRRDPVDYSYTCDYSQGKNFWVPGAYEQRAYAKYGGTWAGWWGLLAFAHDGVADSLISTKINGIVAGTDLDINSPWEMVNAYYIANQGQGGCQGGKKAGFGGSYYSHYTANAPHMLSSHDQATGESLSPKFTLLSKQGQDYFYDSYKHYLDNNGKQSIGYAHGIATGVDAGLARWAENREAAPYAFSHMPRIILGDLRVAPVTPQAAGLALAPGQTVSSSLWTSLTGYDILPGGTDTQIRVNTRRMDLERIPADCGTLAIRRGDTMITTNGDMTFQKRTAYSWSGQVVKEPGGIDGHRYPFFAQNHKSLGYIRAKTPKQALAEGSLRWKPPVEQTGTDWGAVHLNLAPWHVAGDFGLTDARRTVFHHRAKNIILVWDKISAPSDHLQGITYRHTVSPVVNGSIWTTNGAKFQQLKPASHSLQWIGGLNKEAVDIFDQTTWKLSLKAGVVQGYSINPISVQLAGLGAMAVQPTVYAADQYYLTAIDIDDQYADAVINGDTVTIDGMDITIDSNGVVAVAPISVNRN